MTIVLIDAICAVAVIAGLIFAFRGTTRTDDPGVYARRISGMMVAAFAFALAAMLTAFHLA